MKNLRFNVIQNALAVVFLLLFAFEVSATQQYPNIILFAFPGAGKGTLSAELVENEKYVQICMGDLLRAEVRNKTKFGKKIAKILEKGDYIDDLDTFNFIKDKIIAVHKTGQPIIFDGYPRTIGAIRLLDDLLIKLDMKNNIIVMHLEIDKDTIETRILNRKVCNKCNIVYANDSTHCKKCSRELDKRPQDNLRILKKRLKDYEAIRPVFLSEIASRGYKILTINANDSKGEVYKQALYYINNNR